MNARLSTRNALAVLLVGTGASTTGCANPISNEIFASDRVFLEALPSKERHVLEVDQDAGDLPAEAVLGPDAPFLLALTVGIAESSNDNILEVLEYVDMVRTLPPTTREANHRSWGPYDHAPGVWIKVDMSREGRSHYDWSFSVSTASEGTFSPFLYGSHFAGDSVAQGDGAFVWDWEALGGELGLATQGAMVVDYDHRDGKELLVDFDEVAGQDDAAVLDGSYYFYSDGTVGDFEARFPLNLQDDDGDDSTPSAAEMLQMRTRWVKDEGGRSDGQTWDGDWEDLVVDVTQCWDAGNEAVYEYIDAGWELSEGDPSLCVFDEAATVERLAGEAPPE